MYLSTKPKAKSFLILSTLVHLLASIYYASAESWIEDQRPTEEFGLSPRKVHKPLCHSVDQKIELQHSEYEYRPSHFTETYCLQPDLNEDKQIERLVNSDTQMCHFPGFECKQKISLLPMLKRRKHDSDSQWELEYRPIRSSCDCMLPVYSK